METLILCGIYLAELTCFQLGVRILFEVQQKEKAYIWMIFGIVLSIIISFVSFRATGKNFVVTVVVIGIMFMSIQGGMVEKGVILVLVFILLECVDDIFVRSIERFLVEIDYVYEKNLRYLITRFGIAVSMLLLKIIKERIKLKRTHINSFIYFLIGIIAFLMVVCLNLLDQVTIYLPNSRIVNLCNVVSIGVYISIFLLVIFVVYIKKTHERMEQLLKTEKILKEAQVNYYKQVLKKEADTRQYRHDMVNHLIYLRDILAKNRVDDAESYLTNIIGGFKKIQNTYYVTGNEMVDTIMNYFFGMLPKDVDIDIHGRCPIEINVEETDICTIFSNIFQNAVDEIVKSKIENAQIIVEVRKGKHYVEYRIQNSLHTEIVQSNIHKNGLPRSHKADKRNHGIGMTNIKNAVERGNGRFEWSQTDGYFIVTVILPIK